MGSKPFSNMVSDKKSRKGFIDSANEFMDKYGFDGIDIDWEYPAATDLGGRKSDRENLAELVKEMKESFGGKKGISMTVPARECEYYSFFPSLSVFRKDERAGADVSIR